MRGRRAGRGAQVRAIVLTLGLVATSVVGVSALTASPAAAANPLPRFVQVTEGLASTCAVTDAGEAYCWGRDEAGQLGNGTAIVGNQGSAVRVDTPAGVTWASVAAG